MSSGVRVGFLLDHCFQACAVFQVLCTFPATLQFSLACFHQSILLHHSSAVGWTWKWLTPVFALGGKKKTPQRPLLFWSHGTASHGRLSFELPCQAHPPEPSPSYTPWEAQSGREPPAVCEQPCGSWKLWLKGGASSSLYKCTLTVTLWMM